MKRHDLRTTCVSVFVFYASFSGKSLKTFDWRQSVLLGLQILEDRKERRERAYGQAKPRTHTQTNTQESSLMW